MRTAGVRPGRNESPLPAPDPCLRLASYCVSHEFWEACDTGHLPNLARSSGPSFGLPDAHGPENARGLTASDRPNPCRIWQAVSPITPYARLFLSKWPINQDRTQAARLGMPVVRCIDRCRLSPLVAPEEVDISSLERSLSILPRDVLSEAASPRRFAPREYRNPTTSDSL